MGFLTNLIKDRNRQKLEESEMKTEQLSHLVRTHPDPGIKGQAMEELVKEAGLSTKEGQNLLMLVSHMAGKTASDTGPIKIGQMVEGGPNTSIDVMDRPADIAPMPTRNLIPASMPIRPTSYNEPMPPTGHKSPAAWKQILAGFLSQGRTVEESYKRGAEARQQQHALEREREQSRLRSAEDIAKEQRAIATKHAEAPFDLEQARREAVARGEVGAQFGGLPTKELADGTIVQWNPSKRNPNGTFGDWEPATYQGANGPVTMQGRTQPPSIINGKDGAPIGIRRASGQVLTTDTSMLPDEKALFNAAKDAYKADLDRDEQKKQEAENRMLEIQDRIDARAERSQAGMESRFNRTFGRLANQYDFQMANTLRDDYRAQATPFRDRIQAYRALDAVRPTLLNDTTNKVGGHDIALVYNFIRMNDPNRVTEGELQLAQQAQSIPASWWTYVQRLVGRGSDLISPGGRRSLLQAADAIYANGIRPQLRELNNQYADIAGKSNIPAAALAPVDISIARPPKPGATLDATNAQKYLDAAGGDKDKARQMASEDGWSIR